jgi:hypothetical protein
MKSQHMITATNPTEQLNSSGLSSSEIAYLHMLWSPVVLMKDIKHMDIVDCYMYPYCIEIHGSLQN